MLSRYGVEVTPVDDTMLLSFVLDGGLHGHGMDVLADTHLGMTTVKYKDVVGTGKKQITFDYVPLEAARDYAAEDADITLRLHQTLKPRLVQEKMTTVYETIERPLVPVVGAMEKEGIGVDPEKLRGLSRDFTQRLAGLEAEVHELAGEEFNIGSPKQLGEILFEKMSLPGGKKNKSGGYGTDASVLEDLAAGGHDLPARVLEWRQIAKLKSTYSDALLEQINPATGRIHTSYAMAGAQTGRLSSTDPNLQNIPVRTEEGRKIRGAFVAREGWKLLSLDYSQIELRVLAHMAGIDALVDAFRDGQDIHAMTASQVFDVPIEGMDPMVRRQAKAINFGIIYGISAFGLARQLGIARGDAKNYIDAYFERYPGIRDYMDGAGRAMPQGRAGRDIVWPAHPSRPDQRQEPDAAKLCRTAGHQCANPGICRGHHQARHDSCPEGHHCRRPRRPDAPSGTRRTAVRSTGGPSRENDRRREGNDGGRDLSGPRAEGAAGRRRRRWRRLGDSALTFYLIPTPAGPAVFKRKTDNAMLIDNETLRRVTGAILEAGGSTARRSEDRHRPPCRSASQRTPEPRRRHDPALLRGVAPRRTASKQDGFRRHRQRSAADCRRQPWDTVRRLQSRRPRWRSRKPRKTGSRSSACGTPVTSDASAHTARCARKRVLPQSIS